MIYLFYPVQFILQSMGCFGSKNEERRIYRMKSLNENQIAITVHKPIQNKQNVKDQNDIQIQKELSPLTPQITDRQQSNILKEIIKLSDECLEYYYKHQIDMAYNYLMKIQNDLKQLQLRGYVVQMSNHFKEEFIRLSKIISMEYKDVIKYNKQIMSGGWTLKKNQKGVKVSSRIQEDAVGVLLQSTLKVPFSQFISVLVAMDYYKDFIPFVVQSKQLKKVARNCKIGRIVLDLPLITKREAVFQGIAYNRLNNQKQQEQELFMYTRSIHQRKDLQNILAYNVQMNPKYVPLQYKYWVVKYIPITSNEGYIKLGISIDMKVNFIPTFILQMASITAAQDFYNHLIRISKQYKGSQWQQNMIKDPDMFDFFQKVKNDFLEKKNKQK